MRRSSAVGTGIGSVRRARKACNLARDPCTRPRSEGSMTTRGRTPYSAHLVGAERLDQRFQLGDALRGGLHLLPPLLAVPPLRLPVPVLEPATDSRQYVESAKTTGNFVDATQQDTSGTLAEGRPIHHSIGCYDGGVWMTVQPQKAHTSSQYTSQKIIRVCMLRKACNRQERTRQAVWRPPFARRHPRCGAAGSQGRCQPS